MSDEIISWGIIGCGDVTEVKSGPAFNKVNNSRLTAVMRRDAAKAEDYAQRHQVPKWYNDADALINDPDINAIYIATPPAYHEDYAIAALKKGKYVYVEKPVTLNVASCLRIAEVVKQYNGKLCVAHYRRALPLFNAIHNQLQEGSIGKVKLVNLNMYQPADSKIIAQTEENWRVDPAISGGGLFFDLAPHQLDILIWLLGDASKYSGVAANQAKLYHAEDTVVGTMQLGEDILFKGSWCFTMPQGFQDDTCEIIGEKGAIKFAVFGQEYSLLANGQTQNFKVPHPQHVQQPMIEKVVNYFLDKGSNPCTIEEATKSMQVMEAFAKM